MHVMMWHRWSMDGCIGACKALLGCVALLCPCRLSTFLHFPSLFLHFLTPAFHKLQQEKKKGFSRVSFSLNAVVQSERRDVSWVGFRPVGGAHDTKWELLPFGLKKTDARDALYEEW
jgi:hypothetical protein